MSFVNPIGNQQIDPAVARGMRAAGQSFVLGYVFNTLLSNLDFATGLVGGTLSTVASIVDSVTRPMIAGLFEAGFHNSRLEFLTRVIVVLTVVVPLAVVVAPMMGMTQPFDATTVLVFRLALGMIAGASMWDHHLYVV